LRFQLQRRRFGDNVAEHLPGRPAFGGFVTLPHVWVVLRQDVFEIAIALDAARGEGGDVDVAGPVVAVLDEEPGTRLAVLIQRGFAPSSAAGADDDIVLIGPAVGAARSGASLDRDRTRTLARLPGPDTVDDPRQEITNLNCRNCFFIYKENFWRVCLFS